MFRTEYSNAKERRTQRVVSQQKQVPQREDGFDGEVVGEKGHLMGSHWTTLRIFSALSDQTTLPATAPPLSSYDVEYVPSSLYKFLPSLPPPLQLTSARSALVQLFDSRDHALRTGITIADTNFAVHNWETTRDIDLVYGRMGDAVSGAGACAFRYCTNSAPIFGLITYSFPSVSANAVAKLLTYLRSVATVDAKSNFRITPTTYLLN